MAGGRSTRMGQDKAQVMLGRKTLLAHAMDTWRGWGGALFVSVGERTRRGLVPPGTLAVCDRVPGLGPMGGLHAGLTVCRTEYLLLCAVDTPFLKPRHAETLLARIRESDACVYAAGGRAQPLFGLYRAVPCLKATEALLAEECYRMQALLDRVIAATVLEAEEDAFENLNTPEALRRAQWRRAEKME